MAFSAVGRSHAPSHNTHKAVKIPKIGRARRDSCRVPFFKFRISNFDSQDSALQNIYQTGLIKPGLTRSGACCIVSRKEAPRETPQREFAGLHAPRTFRKFSKSSRERREIKHEQTSIVSPLCPCIQHRNGSFRRHCQQLQSPPSRLERSSSCRNGCDRIFHRHAQLGWQHAQLHSHLRQPERSNTFLAHPLWVS